MQMGALSRQRYGNSVFSLLPMRTMVRLVWLLTLSSILVDPSALLGQRLLGRSAATLREVDRIRLAESFRLAQALQDSVWAGWSRAPFAVLLVTPEHEFLIRHPAPSSEFESIGYDSLLLSEVFVRPRMFAPNLLATFPAVEGVPTVVIGQPEHTGKSSTLWILTVLHEHFHQLQMSHPAYHRNVEDLDLAQGDQTGMWMLNHPFPYGSSAVQERFRSFAQALARALGAVDTPDFRSHVESYRTQERALHAVLSERDRRYLAFQLWQEGIARYTEDQVAQLAARAYTPTDAFRALPDYLPFPAAADSLRQGILRGLKDDDLSARKRVAFYPVGAAIGLLMDRTVPEWKRGYLDEILVPSHSQKAAQE